MNLRHAAAAMLAATIVIVSAANAQMQQTSIKVDNADCTVTEMPAGRSPTHLVQLTGPQGAAMISVNKDNKITAYLSPPGGGEYKALIDKVWAAYLDQKNGGAGAAPTATAAAGGPTQAAEPSDSSKALQDQANAILANAQARAAGGTVGGKLTVDFPASGGAVVTKGSRVLTLSPDGADVTVVDTSVTGQSRTERASYEGDGTDKDYDVDIGKAVKGTLQAGLLTYGGENRVQATKDRWKLTNAKGNTITSSGGVNLSFEKHDTEASIGNQVLRDVGAAEKAAQEEATNRKNAGRPVGFDREGDPRGRHAEISLNKTIAQLKQ